MVLITSAIDTHKRRDMTVVNIPGEFLTEYMHKEVIMVLQGSLAEPMVKTDPSI